MKAKILWNSKKQWAKKLSSEVEAILKKKKVKLVKAKADFTVVIGGDGTILYHKDKLEGVVFAIGSKKSFVCQASNSNWEKPLQEFLSNPKYEERMLLEAEFGKKRYLALNDVVLLSQFHNVLTISTDISGDKHEFDADGVVVATPTGSTAYAYAAGGPVIEPTLEVVSVVPIAPDKRLFDPVVISAEHKIVLSASEPAYLVVDGEKPFKTKKGEKIKIKKAKKKIKFAIR